MYNLFICISCWYFSFQTLSILIRALTPLKSLQWKYFMGETGNVSGRYKNVLPKLWADHNLPAVFTLLFVAVPVSSCMVLTQSRSSHLQNTHRAHTVSHPQGLWLQMSRKNSTWLHHMPIKQNKPKKKRQWKHHNLKWKKNIPRELFRIWCLPPESSLSSSSEKLPHSPRLLCVRV